MTCVCAKDIYISNCKEGRGESGVKCVSRGIVNVKIIVALMSSHGLCRIVRRLGPSDSISGS
jgi:hypothetical protein